MDDRKMTDMTKPEEPFRSKNITLGEDGVYRWTYEMHLMKNFSIYFLIWKIFFFIFLGIFAVIFLPQLFTDYDMFVENLPETGRFLLYFLIGMTAISFLGYFIYAAIMGWKYIVEFEMDGKGINHRQTASQAKKAKVIGEVTTLAGIKTGSPTTAGIGMTSARTEMYSEFSKVRKVRAYPSRHLIKVNERFGHNQVYCEKEDFGFVKEYIISHCENLKNRK